MTKFNFLISLSLLTITSFAQRTVGIFQNDSTSLNGYTLIAPLNSTETYLINNCGDIVNQWQNSPYKPGASVELLSDGSLLRTGKITTGTIIAGGSGGKIEKYDWNDNLIWSYDFDGPNERQHHDVLELPNGNLLVLSWDVRSQQQAVSDGLDTTFYNGELWSEKVIEIQPTGTSGANIIWEWYLRDHLIQDFNSTVNNFGVVSQNPQLVNLNYSNNSSPSKDFYHANGLDYNPDLDQILISLRNYDEFWIIDHSTTTSQAATHLGGNTGKGGDIIYRWGNPETYDQGTISDKKLFGQHNPNWIHKGFRDEGKIMVFNNGFNDPRGVSRVEIIDPPVDTFGNYTAPTGIGYLPLNTSWTFSVPVFVDFVSGAERLENGNTLICSGPDGHIYEIDSNDSLQWEYINPAGLTITSQGSVPSSNTIYRAIKYPEDYPAFNNRNLTGTRPIESNPIVSNCVLYSTLTSIKNIDNNLDLTIVQNPIQNSLEIKNSTNQTVTINVFDLLGRSIYSTNKKGGRILINSENWNSEIYLVVINNGNNVFRQKIVKID